MVLMSTKPVAELATERWPSTSTSVRLAPRLRRLTALIPALAPDSEAVDEAGEADPEMAGIWLTKLAILGGDCDWMSSAPSTLTGVGAE